MKFKIIILCFFVIASFYGHAQYLPAYSQYVLHPLSINPAYAGSVGALSITGSYRNQWSKFEGSPTTQVFSLHTPLKRIPLSLGLLAVHDQFGVSNQSQINGILAYRFAYNKHVFSAGFQVGISFIKNDFASLITIQKGDPNFAESQTWSLPKIGFGISYQHKSWTIGASLPQMYLRSQNDLFQKSIFFHPFMFQIQYLKQITQSIELKPFGLIKYYKSSPTQLDLGCIATYHKKYSAGIIYRIQDAVVGMIALHLTPQLQIGYTYDYITGPLNPYQAGSHEVVLRYDFKYIVASKDPKFAL